MATLAQLVGVVSPGERSSRAAIGRVHRVYPRVYSTAAPSWLAAVLA